MTPKTQRQPWSYSLNTNPASYLQASGFVGGYHVYNTQSNVDHSRNLFFFSTADSCDPTFFCPTATV